MENENFFKLLLMTIFGIILWILVAMLIISSIFGMIDKAKLEKEGKKAIAEVTFISYNREKRTYNYHIEYIINGKEYRDEFKTKDNTIKKGEKITVYYLSGKEDKIYLSKQNNIGKNIFSFIFTIIILLPIAYFGKVCITKYNVFKYKRTINVE